VKAGRPDDLGVRRRGEHPTNKKYKQKERTNARKSPSSVSGIHFILLSGSMRIRVYDFGSFLTDSLWVKLTKPVSLPAACLRYAGYKGKGLRLRILNPTVGAYRDMPPHDPMTKLASLPLPHHKKQQSLSHEDWVIGMLEYWNVGTLVKTALEKASRPLFHRSTIPTSLFRRK
jgi:hypothetical protein